MTITTSANAPLVAQSLVPLIVYVEPSSLGVARHRQPRRVGADVGLGEQERADVGARHLGQPLLLLLVGAEQHQRLRQADRLVGRQQRRQRGCARRRPARAPCCSRPGESPRPPYSVGIFMPSAPSCFRPSTTSSGIFASRSIASGSTLFSRKARSSARNASPLLDRVRPAASAADGSGRAGSCRGTAPCRSSAASIRSRGLPRRPGGLASH